MLNHFPAPYPDELWYSVLARYHARSGNRGMATSTRELLGNHATLPSVFFANQGFGGLFERLPEGMLDKTAVLQQHTLLKQYANKGNIRITANYVILYSIKSFLSFACVMVFSLVTATSLTWRVSAKSQNTKVRIKGEIFVDMFVTMSLVLAGLGVCRVV